MIAPLATTSGEFISEDETYGSHVVGLVVTGWEKNDGNWRQFFHSPSLSTELAHMGRSECDSVTRRTRLMATTAETLTMLRRISEQRNIGYRTKLSVKNDWAGLEIFSAGGDAGAVVYSPGVRTARSIANMKGRVAGLIVGKASAAYNVKSANSTPHSRNKKRR